MTKESDASRAPEALDALTAEDVARLKLFLEDWYSNYDARQIMSQTPFGQSMTAVDRLKLRELRYKAGAFSLAPQPQHPHQD